MRDNVNGGALTEVTFFILLALYTPNHGYGIMQFIKDKTQGRLLLGAGSLYGALNNLVKKNWICATDDGTARKKEYVITELGKSVADAELARIKQLYLIAEDIMKEGMAHEESI